MRKIKLVISALIMPVIFLSILSCGKSGNTISESQSTAIDLNRARKIVDSIDNQFTNYFYEGDSVALYNMYAKGA